MARAAENTINLDFLARRNSDLVAGAAEQILSSDLRARGNSDLVVGLEGIEI